MPEKHPMEDKHLVSVKVYNPETMNSQHRVMDMIKILEDPQDILVEDVHKTMALGLSILLKKQDDIHRLLIAGNPNGHPGGENA